MPLTSVEAAVRKMEEGMQRVEEKSLGPWTSKPAVERHKPPPLQLSTAADGSKTHAVAEGLNSPIDNDFSSPVQSPVDETKAYRPGLAAVHEHGEPQVTSADPELEKVEIKSKKLEEQITSPHKSFGCLRDKPPSAKKLVVSKDPFIDHCNPDEDSDSSACGNDSPGSIT